jgi:hypothetical protein
LNCQLCALPGANGRHAADHDGAHPTCWSRSGDGRGYSTNTTNFTVHSQASPYGRCPRSKLSQPPNSPPDWPSPRREMRRSPSHDHQRRRCNAGMTPTRRQQLLLPLSNSHLSRSFPQRSPTKPTRVVSSVGWDAILVLQQMHAGKSGDGAQITTWLVCTRARTEEIRECLIFFFFFGDRGGPLGG